MRALSLRPTLRGQIVSVCDDQGVPLLTLPDMVRYVESLNACLPGMLVDFGASIVHDGRVVAGVPSGPVGEFEQIGQVDGEPVYAVALPWSDVHGYPGEVENLSVAGAGCTL